MRRQYRRDGSGQAAQEKRQTNRERKERREEDGKEKEEKGESRTKGSSEIKTLAFKRPGESEHQRTWKRRPKSNRRHKKEGCGPRTTEQACSVQENGGVSERLSTSPKSLSCRASAHVGSSNFWWGRLAFLGVSHVLLSLFFLLAFYLFFSQLTSSRHLVWHVFRLHSSFRHEIAVSFI